MSKLLRGLIALALLIALAGGWLWYVNYADGVDVHANPAPQGEAAALLERGAYLAQVGNCLACHTARGGEAAAGGNPIPTPFGTVYSSNLTPHQPHGIGGWSTNRFWRALHHGRGGDGRLLTPVFPYTHTTLLTRADSDALYTYFMSLPPADAATPRNELRWPYSTQLAQAAWRARYFKAGTFTPDPARDAQWNRGAYLVQAVTHCSVCHAGRDLLGGANWERMDGGLMKAQRWWAPSLLDPAAGGLLDWPADEIVRLLRDGVAEHGRASGPMAEVVLKGTQHLKSDDLSAMASYLQDPPGAGRPAPGASNEAHHAVRPQARELGRRLYDLHCADCHGDQGQGQDPAYPALAGNRAVLQPQVDNLLQVVLNGGFNAATAGYPRPFGMPPFASTLNDREIAAVLTWVRSAWGNDAGGVSTATVHSLRDVGLLDGGR